MAKSGNCEIAKQILDAKSVDINDMDPHMVHFFVLRSQLLALSLAFVLTKTVTRCAASLSTVDGGPYCGAAR